MEGNAFESALYLHDALLINVPSGAHHDFDACSFCTEWSVSDDGIPSGFGRLEIADASKPYGDVTYADPGYQKDGVKRYPIDTEAHARAAWSYIHQASSADKYSADQLASIRTKVAAALKKFGIDAEKKAEELRKPPAPAAPAKKKADKSELDATPDAASEGGNTHMETTQETILTATHEALLEKALKDATTTLTGEKAALEGQVSTLTEAATKNVAEIASLKTENERLNGELDTAQVSLKAATDEVATLKADIASKEAEATKAEIATARAAQVRNLGLFTEEYITEKSSRWADVDETAWNERLDEWKVAKGTSTTQSGTTTTDTASAMTGTRDAASGSEPSARRQILGLAAVAQ